MTAIVGLILVVLLIFGWFALPGGGLLLTVEPSAIESSSQKEPL